jgi:hypothetical protein
MDRKRSVYALVLFSLVLVGSLFLVSAQASSPNIVEQGVEGFKNGVVSAVNLLFRDFLQSYQTGQDIFYVKLLLFILLYVMVQTGVKAIPRLGEQKAIAIIVSFIVSVLAVKWMGDGLITTILMPYGALGVALATLLPFLIFFYFVHATKMAGIGRRIAWIFFALSFFLVAANRWKDIDPTGQTFYYVIGGLVLLALIFDKGIHQYFFMHELNLFYRGAKGKAIAALQAEYLNIIHVDSPESEKRRKDIEENLKRLGGSLP